MSDLRADRQAKLDKIVALGFNPYGGDAFSSEEDAIPTTHIRSIIEICPNSSKDDEPDSGNVFRCSGRIVLRREMGNLHFLTIRDGSGDVQIALSKKYLSESMWALAKLIDLGDVIAFQGPLALTQKGEPTLWAREFVYLAKSLVPPPDKHEGLVDIESRYRKRYVDLWSNPDVRDAFRIRANVIHAVRTFLDMNYFLEVETPSLHPISGGASAEPFVTRHNALDANLFMRIAPELYLKKLIVGGFEKVYEIGKNFRNEGLDSKHNPEFTALEFYRVDYSYKDVMAMIEAMMQHIVSAFEYGTIEYVNLFGDGIETITMEAAVSRYLGKSCSDLSAEDQFKVYDEHVEKTLIGPTFVTHLPASKVPLAKVDAEGYAESFEFVVNGVEIGCGYSEQNNPEKQLAVLLAQADGDRSKIDWDFIEALNVGMPVTGGCGIGIDRLVMLFADVPSIKDVILFPAMRTIQGETV